MRLVGGCERGFDHLVDSLERDLEEVPALFDNVNARLVSAQGAREGQERKMVVHVGNHDLTSGHGQLRGALEPVIVLEQLLDAIVEVMTKAPNLLPLNGFVALEIDGLGPLEELVLPYRSPISDKLQSVVKDIWVVKLE